MNGTILGIHHITAITDDPQRNVDFYTGVLGLRLVKVTVNFDDPGSYHFYYGDGCGHPGTILTFFTWPEARRGQRGNSQVTATSFAIPRGSAQFWLDRLAAQAVEFGNLESRFGQTVIPFSDHDGMQLLHQGHRERVAGIAGRTQARLVVDNHPDVGDSQAGGGGGGQRAAGAGTCTGHQPRKKRQIDGHPRRKLAVAAAGADAPQRAGHRDRSGLARSRNRQPVPTSSRAVK